MDRVEDQLNRSVLGRTVLDGLIRDVVQQRLDQYKALEEGDKSPTPVKQEGDLQDALEEEFKPLEVSSNCLFYVCSSFLYTE